MKKIFKNTLILMTLISSFSAIAQTWVHGAQSSSGRYSLLANTVNYYRPSDVSGIEGHLSKSDWFHMYARADGSTKNYMLLYKTVNSLVYSQMIQLLSLEETTILSMSSGNTNLWYISETAQ